MALKIGGLRRFREEVSAALDRGVDRAADYGVDIIEQLAPKDSGDMASTVRKEGEQGTRKRTILVGGIDGKETGKPVDYPPFVEYGTSTSPAQPFFTPGVKAIDIKQETKAEVAALIARCKA